MTTTTTTATDLRSQARDLAHQHIVEGRVPLVTDADILAALGVTSPATSADSFTRWAACGNYRTVMVNALPLPAEAAAERDAGYLAERAGDFDIDLLEV